MPKLRPREIAIKSVAAFTAFYRSRSVILISLDPDLKKKEFQQGPPRFSSGQILDLSLGGARLEMQKINQVDLPYARERVKELLERGEHLKAPTKKKSDPFDPQTQEELNRWRGKIEVLAEESRALATHVKKLEAEERQKQETRPRIGAMKMYEDRIASCDGRAVVYKDSKPVFEDTGECVFNYVAETLERRKAKARKKKMMAKAALQQITNEA